MSEPSQNGSFNSAKRKSFALFSRQSTLAVPESPSWTAKDDSAGFHAKPRPKSALFNAVNDSIDPISINVSSNRRVPGKGISQRPRSMFGSFKTREPSSPTVVSSASSSIESSTSEQNRGILPMSTVIVHAGEVVTGGGLLRKKREYMVLTKKELLKYKSESKANDAFGLGCRYASGRVPSIGSTGDMVSEHSLVTQMNQVVAVYYPGGDNEVGCCVQVDYLDGSSGLPSSTILIASNGMDAQNWVDKLRSVAVQTRLSLPALVYPDSTVEHIARRLEAENDYSPMHFQIFRVIQRPGKSGNKSVEDLQRMYSTMCYLAIGIHKVHLVPLRPVMSKSTASLANSTSSSFGILNLTSLWLAGHDDCFSLIFRYMMLKPLHRLTKFSN
jgi:hypothetical protein